ncbi:MAG: efflux RND transporter periplasmic adaptor subunit [Planctomycetota bacterium]
MTACSVPILNIFGLAGCLLAVLDMGACRSKPADKPLPTAVRVITVEREQIASELRYSATVIELQKVDLSFKVPGLVRELFQTSEADGLVRDVQEGDRVPAGAVIAKLDDEDYLRQWQIAQEHYKKAVQQQAAAEADASNAQQDYERAESLMAQKAIARQQFDAAIARLEAARATAEAARREVETARVSEQQAKSDLAECQLIVPDMQIALVKSQDVEKGERVASNQRAFQLIDLAKVRVVFGAPDTLVGRIKLRQPLRVVCEALGNAVFEGRVSKIAPAADLGTRTFPVEVTIDDPGELRPGMIVTINLGEQVDGILLPMTAVQRGSSKQDFAVFEVVPEGGRQIVRKRLVDLGGVYDNRIQVKDSPKTEIAPGGVIVVNGASRLVEGQEVRVLETPPQGAGI